MASEVGALGQSRGTEPLSCGIPSQVNSVNIELNCETPSWCLSLEAQENRQRIRIGVRIIKTQSIPIHD